MKRQILTLLVILGILSPLVSMEAQSQSTLGVRSNLNIEWNLRSSPTNTDLQAITFGSGVFVTVGRNGRILSSPDGVVWTLRDSGVTRTFYGVAYGQGIFAAIGASGQVVTSPDGVAWTKQDTRTTANFNSVNYANGLFMAAGDGGNILTSPDGRNWTPYKTASTNYWQAITFANSQYMAVGYDYRSGKAQFGVTPNFTTWHIDYTGNGRYLDDIVFDSEKLVSVGYAGSLQLSTNGSDWSAVTNANVSRWLFDLVHANGLFLAVGESGTMTASTNGINWVRQTSGTTKSLNGIAFGVNTFVAVGNEGTILQSNPITPPPAALILTQAGNREGRFGFNFAGDMGNPYEIQVSTNLIQWSTLATVNLTNSHAEWTDGHSNGPLKFYRVARP